MSDNDLPFVDIGEISVEEYKKHVQTLPCLICGKVAEGHHLFPVGMGRNRKVPRWEDYTRVPLCNAHHINGIHIDGQKDFELKHSISLYKEALIILSKFVFERTNNEKS